MKKTLNYEIDILLLTDLKEWESGWVLFDGSFYGCMYGGHSLLARMIFKQKYNLIYDDSFDFEKESEKRNWLKITKDNDYFSMGQKISQKQKNTLFDHCTMHQIKYRLNF